MSRFVLDCSVTMAWCFEDQADDSTEKVLESFSHFIAVVPDLWRYEVMNVLWVAEKRKKITSADSSRFLDLLKQLPIVLEDSKDLTLTESPLSLSREHHLSIYDSAYLHLAMTHGLPLATRDHDLEKACQRCGVKIFKGR